MSDHQPVDPMDAENERPLYPRPLVDLAAFLKACDPLIPKTRDAYRDEGELWIEHPEDDG
jgi:hypothetical protein